VRRDAPPCHWVSNRDYREWEAAMRLPQSGDVPDIVDFVPRVELLRDGKGVYGVGVHHSAKGQSSPAKLILRSDRLQEASTTNAALQMIPSGGGRGVFKHVIEEQLRRHIHYDLLSRRGLKAPSDDKHFWSSDPHQQAVNRQLYHGLRRASETIINRIIKVALAEAAQLDALEAARRFRLRYRYRIYRAAITHRRALQLANTFPVLSLAIFGPGMSSLAGEGALLVASGAPLKEISSLMRVPMAFRKIQPGAADLGLKVIRALKDERLIHSYMPDSLPKMKLWLRCIALAEFCGDADFIRWVARRASEIGGSSEMVLSSLRDLTDWAEASRRATDLLGDSNAFADPLRPSGEQFVVRRFRANMSLKTVAGLSNDWHEAVASGMSGPTYEFPEPWCDGGEHLGHAILPIVNAADLYREGRTMHHCVGSYSHRVLAGQVYIYTIRKNLEPIATLELVRDDGTVSIGQIRGPFNSRVSKEVQRAAKQWIKVQREFKLPEVAVRKCNEDDDIPF
jgi:PcfJ-like protein